MSDFDQFQEEVINAYRKKIEKRLLPLELERPSPTQLMNYCLTRLHRGELKEDLSTLNRIFNPLNRYPDLETGIKEFGAVGFKSLRNFMIGNTTKPREHIVKLLAVLIDFQPRPYDVWVRERNENTLENRGEKVDEVSFINDPESNQTGNAAQEENKSNEGLRLASGVWSKLKKPVLYSVITFSGMLGAYHVADHFDRECMYWKTDRYVSVACNEKIEDVEIIPLDDECLKRFRKIMRPDTLTLRSVGRVWYAKPTVNSVEFYTMKGFYPMDSRKELKPATEYIIRKYVLEKESLIPTTF